MEPLACIARAQSIAVSDLYASWAGRWVLLGRDQVHMDASGLLGCFYGIGLGNRTWVSSSPGLLWRILSAASPLPIDPRRLRYEAGLSWFTPPRSRFIGMQRLLTSQIINLRTGEVLPRPLMPDFDTNKQQFPEGSKT
jgi:hypothetical protein